MHFWIKTTGSIVTTGTVPLVLNGKVQIFLRQFYLFHLTQVNLYLILAVSNLRRFTYPRIILAEPDHRSIFIILLVFYTVMPFLSIML